MKYNVVKKGGTMSSDYIADLSQVISPPFVDIQSCKQPQKSQLVIDRFE